MDSVRSSFVVVDGARTHVLEVGDGPPVVLLHSGEFGGCAEASWAHLMPGLAAAGYRVVAPDWLGFGRTDKIVDFADPKGRRIRHMAAVIDHLGLDEPAVVGNSMGGTYLAQDLAGCEPLIPAAVAVLVSAGGFVPDNEARRAIQSYDLTERSMADILRVMLHSPRFAGDPGYVRWRWELSREPGAWQVAESARLRPPGSAPGSEFGKPDNTAYHRIKVPVQVIAGANDPLRLPGYADELAARITDAELVVYEECGHMPNVEHPEQFLADVVSFLKRRYRNQERSDVMREHADV